MKIPGIMLAAPSSGSGKTVAACGIMAALQRRKLQVAACKVGPDYIDPMFHKEVLGISSENLDLYFSSEIELKDQFARHGMQADITVVEGVMGYFDGYQFGTEKGSSCEVADVLGLPVILVVSCKGMSTSILALLKGMLEFRKKTQIHGIILNRVSDMVYPRMKEMLEQGLEEMGHGDVRVLGYLPEHEVFGLESRHLGLVLPEEVAGLQTRILHAAEILEKTIDLDMLLELAEDCKELPEVESEERDEPVVTVAVAKDEAMCFYYRENLSLLEKCGCKLVPFSPIHDKQLPPGTAGVIIGGGYPEKYGRELSQNEEMRMELREKIQHGMPCLAECGGFMYLLEELEDMDGTKYPMVGVISGESHSVGKLCRFGYVEMESQKEGTFLKKGEKIKGHEFHYWDCSNNGEDCLAVKPDGKRKWQCIHMEGNLFAGYPHMYYRSNPEFVSRFVEACKNWVRLNPSPIVPPVQMGTGSKWPHMRK